MKNEIVIPAYIDIGRSFGRNLTLGSVSNPGSTPSLVLHLAWFYT